MFRKNSDPLTESIQKVMKENTLRRKLEESLNEELGISSKKALPHEYHAAYDSVLSENIDKALNEETKIDPQVAKTMDDGITTDAPRDAQKLGPPKFPASKPAMNPTDQEREALSHKVRSINPPGPDGKSKPINEKTIKDILSKFKSKKNNKVFPDDNEGNYVRAQSNTDLKGVTGKALPDKKKMNEQSSTSIGVRTLKVPNPNILSPRGNLPVPRRIPAMQFDKASADKTNDTLNRGVIPSMTAPAHPNELTKIMPMSTLPPPDTSKFATQPQSGTPLNKPTIKKNDDLVGLPGTNLALPKPPDTVPSRLGKFSPAPASPPPAAAATPAPASPPPPAAAATPAPAPASPPVAPHARSEPKPFKSIRSGDKPAAPSWANDMGGGGALQNRSRAFGADTGA